MVDEGRADREAAPSHSVLFDRGSSRSPIGVAREPEHFRDLNLDQVVATATAGRAEYDLAPFFHTPLPDVDAVTYRHDAFRDLEGTPLLGHVRSFAQEMRAMRDRLAQADKLRYTRQKQRWFLDATDAYRQAVVRLAEDLVTTELASAAFLGLREYVTRYVASERFTSLIADIDELRAALDAVHYCVRINGDRVDVSRYEQQPDYSDDVLATFEKFKQAAVDVHRGKFTDWPDMNHVETQILDLVAQLYPETFAALGRFGERHRGYLDATIAAFDREVQFYLAYHELVARFRAAGLAFCYPRVSCRSKQVSASDTFDLALAGRLVGEHAPVVCNDFHLGGGERVFVVTGPNQGGKTTFARTFGQLHYLASLGCPVPGTDATLFLCDRLFTHFEREEDLDTLSGKLQDDLLRIHAVLEQATPDSVILLNEIFTSTTLADAVFLGTNVLERLIRLDALCLCVTFVDEWAALGDTVVSMVSTVDPHDPAVRTYKIVRRPADGRAYAAALAEKYGLTYRQLKERVGT